MLSQERDVLGARPQGRHRHDIEGKPVEEIAAEPARLGEGRQVGIGGGDEADIDGQGLVAADPLEGAVLDDTQHLFLHGLRGGGDLVEEERAAIGQFEARGSPAHRAGEGAGLVPEKLAVEQRFGERGTVDGEERLVPTRREISEPRRDQLLAGAASGASCETCASTARKAAASPTSGGSSVYGVAL